MSENGNFFQTTANDLQKTPPAQRTEKLIDEIATQMQSSSSPQVKQFGQDLANAKGALARACQQS
jgi:hypothetical protein